MTTTHLRTTRRERLIRRVAVALVTAFGLGVAAAAALPASAAGGYDSLYGEGSSWAGEALNQWTSDVHAMGVSVTYAQSGSSTGRKKFAQSIDAQFAVSEIPYTGDTADPQDQVRPSFSYNMLPIVSGGTSFMYNLKVGGNRFTGLKLSQAAIAGIFTGQITQWNDPAIAADNPGVPLPAQRITVVVRSEGSGATAQFTLWLMRQFPQQYKALCKVTGCDPSHGTSYFPHSHLDNFVGQQGSTGVTTYTASTPYTINYDEYAYALKAGFPVAQVKNAAGFYTVPDQNAVAVAMTQAKINLDQSSPEYLSQDLSNVYQYKDPRTYPLSMYTYQLAPTQVHDGNLFSERQGRTLGFFDQYALCEGQRTMGALGYSPLPMNLVLAALNQVLQVPGVDADTKAKIAATGQAVAAGSGNPCNNPTFAPGDSPSVNQLVKTAPFPAGCDAACQAPWAGSTGANNGPGGGGGTTSGGTTTTDPNKVGTSTTDPNASDAPTALVAGATVTPGAPYVIEFPDGTFSAGETVDGVVHSDPVNVGSVAASATGAVKLAFTMPDPLEVGDHTLTLTGATSGTVKEVAFVVGVGGEQVCDPDTGECTSTTSGGKVVTASNVMAIPAVISGSSGWAGPQTLMVLLGLFVVLGLFVPAIVGRFMSARRAVAGGRR